MLREGDDGRRFLSGTFGEINGLTSPPPPGAPAFLPTREHRRFTEFADTVRAHRYIGLCWGPPGVGKTLSARHYAGAPQWEQWQRDLGEDREPGPIPERVLQARTALWTPTVTASPRQVDQALPRACQQISYAIDYHHHGRVDPFVHPESRSSGLTELLIIDEADRLKTTGLEQVRDYYDRHTLGVILIGMPGIDKRLGRYPQLYSRVGFAHEYRPLTPEELTAVLTRRWHTDGLAGEDDEFTRTVAIATIARITGGNFRLVDRLLTQIQRILEINHLATVTPEVVEAARDALLIGH
ncbi:AAA family ATPase [uncultured Kocuria sp.]|uniref:AAA family ATPase n=1 Tax=uncultured Kocuria sp. TaxID=259305 RepID=UPI00261E494D|nr:AAA family ATPase [uncultured Kocuria sp.]